MYICIITSEIIFKDIVKKRVIDELIEFTSILLKEEDGDIEYIEIYHKYIKPMEYMNIGKECWEERGIKLDVIKNEGIIFEEFIENYYKWICNYKKNDDNLVIITIDPKIIYLLGERCKKINREIMWIFKRYYTIRDIYRMINVDSKDITLGGILFELGLSLHIRYSGCIDDCRSIARIIEKIYLDNNNKIKNIFNLNRDQCKKQYE